MLRDLSYRLKTPLAMSLVIFATTVTVSGALLWQGYREAQAAYVQHARSLGKVLARTVRPALLHDDVWQAYEILFTPLERSGDEGRVFVLVDAREQIFAASEPRQFPVLDDISHAARDPHLALALASGATDQQRVINPPNGRFLYVLTPVLSEDEAVLGQLIQRYDHSLIGPRVSQVATGTLLSGLAALTLLLPLGWIAGKRLTQPLTHLAECLTRVGRETPDAIDCEFPPGRDEISQLADRFRGMVAELRTKQALEKHLAMSDRLAAIGRLSAGIAHEINNPLGGMLNAISNYRRRGSPDPQAEKTLSLIERGLDQVRNTVSALLVETRLESRALEPDDLEDVRTLTAPDIQKKRLRLAWHNGVRETLPLPSAQIRQVLLNLVLNAIAASFEGAELGCEITTDPGQLSLVITNSGPPIPPRRREHLFEPYFGEGEVHGLGLWVTYQLVSQLRGQIEVESSPGQTCFRVSIPLEPAHE